MSGQAGSNLCGSIFGFSGERSVNEDCLHYSHLLAASILIGEIVTGSLVCRHEMVG